MFTGESTFEHADKANAEAKARGAFSPLQKRFYLPQGKSAEMLILDKKIEVGAYEHDLPIPGKKFKKYVPCIAAIPGMNCPLCRAGDIRHYRMFVTVLDLSGYTTKKGTVVARSKKLMAINQGDKEKWQNIQNDVLATHGTMRGTYIFMQRPNEQRSSRNGEPTAVAGSGGRIWQHMSEPEIVKAYGHKAVIDNGKVVRPANDDITPYNFAQDVFPFPDEEFVAGLEAAYGAGIPATGEQQEEPAGGGVGSDADVEQEWAGNEEIPDGNPEGGEAVSVDGLGEAADGGNVEAQQTLTEVAATHSIDVEQLADWAAVEAAITEATGVQEPEPEPEPAKPAPRPIVKPGGVKLAPRPAGKLPLRPVVKPAPVAGKPGGLVRPNAKAFGG